MSDRWLKFALWTGWTIVIAFYAVVALWSVTIWTLMR